MPVVERLRTVAPSHTLVLRALCPDTAGGPARGPDSDLWLIDITMPNVRHDVQWPVGWPGHWPDEWNADPGMGLHTGIAGSARPHRDCMY